MSQFDSPDHAAPIRRRRLLWVFVALVGVLVMAHLAGGWYFSGLLHSDGLVPTSGERNMDVRVVALGPNGRISLDGGDRKAIEQPGVTGLWWPEGHGRLGPVLDVQGGIVTRSFTLTAGSLPPVCTGLDPESCDEVDIDAHVYRSDPADAGLGFENIQFESELGALNAWIVPAGQPTGVWAVHVHGWRVDRREALRMLPTYERLGITSMVIEYRNDPGAPADPSGLYRFGRSEWVDVDAAVAYAREHGAEEIILAGYSTGAAIEMAFLENSPQATDVIAVVFDAPNIDFGSTVKLEASRRSIPGTPVPLPPTLTATAMWLADARWDVDWSEIDYVSRPGILEVPALVFHGTRDTTVPIEVSHAFAERNPDVVTLVETTGEHVQSWNVDPERYEAALADFLSAVS